MRGRMPQKYKKGFHPYIEGRRLFLREVRQEDVNDDYYSWMNDPEVTRYLETRYIPQSRENISRYVEAMSGKRDEIFLAICMRKSAAHIGNIKLGPINWIHRFADISLIIGEKKCWGKGYGSEAIRMLSRYAFEVLNLRKLRSGLYSDNIGSARAFRKAGFTEEGRLKRQWISVGGFQDELLFGLCEEVWRSNA